MSLSSRKRASSDVPAPHLPPKNPRLWNERDDAWDDDDQPEPEENGDNFLRRVYVQQIQDAEKLIATARDEIRRIHTKYPAESYEFGDPLERMVQSLTKTPAALIREQLEIVHMAKAKLRQP